VRRHPGQRPVHRSRVGAVAAPETPTFREQGFDIVEGSMRGVAAPAGLPREVLDRLVTSVRQAMENDEFRQLAAQQALPLRFLDPDA
jgi:tripartite-type tricarboxylate transporter receptor subunit TctC